MRAPLLVAAAVATSVIGIATASAARPHTAPTRTYEIPGPAVFPESIGVSRADNTFFVGSTSDGTVYKGSIHRPRAHVFLQPGTDGRTTVIGVKLDHAGHLLLAGGGTGQLFVYDRRTGAFVKRFVVPAGGPTFINDVAVTPSGDLYVTDSLRPTVYRIAAADVGTPSADPVELTPWIDLSSIYVSGFNLNGIVSTSHGRYLIAAQTATGMLWRIRVADGTFIPIDLGGVTLPNIDGLAISGHTLYGLQNALGNLVRIDLRPLYAKGTIASVTHDPTFDFPTGLALIPGRALVVNSQFENRGGTPMLPFTVSNVPRP